MRRVISVFVLVFAASCASPHQRAVDLCEEVFSDYWGRDWDTVIEKTTEAIELDPDLPWAYSQRGYAYFEMGMYGQALDDLTLAIELDPQFAPAFFNRGVVYAELRQYGQAFDDLNQAVYINPGDGLAYARLGDVLIKLGNYEDAEKCLEMAIQLSPDFAMPKVLLAGIKAHFGEAEAACGLLARAFEDGYRKREIAFDKTFEPLRDHPCFSEVMRASYPKKSR